MSLTKTDLKNVKLMIDSSIVKNNDLLFARFVDTLKNFVTRDEFQREIAKCAKQEDLLELKSDIIGIKQELGILTTFIMGNHEIK